MSKDVASTTISHRVMISVIEIACGRQGMPGDHHILSLSMNFSF